VLPAIADGQTSSASLDPRCGSVFTAAPKNARMVLDNPYAPPQHPGPLGAAPSPGSPAAADVRLFGPAAIATHSLLFLSPIVGVVLAAINHWRLRDRAALRRTLLVYGVPTVLLLLLSLPAPARLEGLMRLISFGWSLSVATQLHREHSVLVERHLAAGGKKARWWLVTLVVLGLVVLASIAVFTIQELTGTAVVAPPPR
jgi:hypothetical protein